MWKFDEHDPLTGIVLEEMENNGGTAGVNRRVRDRLSELAARGVRWAAMTLDYCEIDGVGKIVSRVIKQEDRSTIFVPGSRKKVELPSVYGVRKRDPETGKRTSAWGKVRWFQGSFELALEISTDLIRSGTREIERGEAIGAVVRYLLAQCPEAETVLDACEKLGIDPRAFGIEDDDLTGTDG